MTKSNFVRLLLSLLMGLVVACSSSPSKPVAVKPELEDEATYYRSLTPSNKQVNEAARAIAIRQNKVRGAQALINGLDDCEAWMVVRREDLQPLMYSFTSLCIGNDDAVKVRALSYPGGIETQASVKWNTHDLLSQLQRPTIVADAGLWISDGSVTFITLFASGKVYRHAIVSEGLVERGDQDYNFALISSALSKVRSIVDEAQHK